MAKMSAADLRDLPPGSFAFPDRVPPEHPIHTPEHAAASIQSATGTKDEQAVKALAYGRWPQLNPALRGARGTNAPFSK